MEKEQALWRRPLLNCAYQEFLDPADLYKAYERVGQATDVIHLAPAHTFRHCIGSLMVNEVPLIAAANTPTRTFLGENSHLALVAVMEGAIHQRSSRGSIQSQSGDVMLSPMAEYAVDITGSRCVLTLQPAAIARAAAAMAGRSSGVVRRARQRLEDVTPITLQAGQPQAIAIHQLIRLIDACFGAGAGAGLIKS